ncbi:mevalonate kinase family protein [Flavobacterium rhizosphaerae]|uniref:Mevalonate kinase n=1 Tax=Flavobacterium rhizosphaerae TaxID=3163298 RepID=A0ABW8YYJ6_9FLAO
MKGPLFYSKILLFGEHGINKGSKGLSIPYNFYNGCLKMSDTDTDVAKKSNASLRGFVDYLETLQANEPQLVSFDTDALRKNVEAGMYFDSSIPQGYGIGSSGALVAAIYDQYANDKITVLENLTQEKLLKLKKIFSKMESYFHGTSSGLDPLNSYLSIPILINSNESIEATGIPMQNLEGKGAIFLLDSGIVKETAPMVQIFMESLKDKGFRSMIKNQFLKYTDACIADFLKGDAKGLFDNTKQLSKVVYKNFKAMIPEQFHELWQKGIESNEYYLKLCGSGGGGYILGFAPDIDRAKEALKGHKVEVVYQF